MSEQKGPALLPATRTQAIQRHVKSRWDVKTASDPEAAGIDQTPRPTTIAQLTSVAAPIAPAARDQQTSALDAGGTAHPVEMTVWDLAKSATTLVGYKYETDQDYHLVVSDANNSTMIVEIPDPTLLSNANPFKMQIAGARAAFDSRFGLQMQALKHLVQDTPQPRNASAPMIIQVNVPIHVVGIGFFEFIHGQNGVAPNGAELHPVLTVDF